MASFRTQLTDDNMDIVMFLVRELDKNPSEVLNMIISNPQLIYDARSGINGKGHKKGWSEKT